MRPLHIINLSEVNAHAYVQQIQFRLSSRSSYVVMLVGSPSSEPMFYFAGSGENLPDITKSRDASLDNDLWALSSRS